jgi:hypothetical protein
MAKVYTGRDGVLVANEVTIAKVVSFQVTANLETLETTVLSDNLRSYTPGAVGYSGSATLLYYKDGDGNINTANILNRLFKTGTAGVIPTDDVEFVFRWVDGSDNNDIKMAAFITSASIGASTGDIVRAEVAFQGTGTLKTVTIS